MNIDQTIATELSIKVSQVAAVVALLDSGSTVPFIARYRKEATGNLDDTQLRNLVARLDYLKEFVTRRNSILKNIEEQGKLTPELKKAILATDNKTTLEDLYLPYKQKRRTKAQIAKEAGLEPLAQQLLDDPSLTPETVAADFISKEYAIEDVKSALDGARYILMERFSEDAGLLGKLRQCVAKQGVMISRVAKDKEQVGAKFSDYFEFSEAVSKIPSHRTLALFRGRKEGFLYLNIGFSDDSQNQACEQMIATKFNVKHQGRAADDWLQQCIAWTWKIKIQTKLELEFMGELRLRAEEEAIKVFKDNLKNLLMMAPAGDRVVLGLDPGLRTGVKVVVVDGTGKLLEYTTIFPHVPRRQWDQSLHVLAALCSKHQVSLVSIGNGTASKETDQLVAALMKQHKALVLTKVVVSEAGASVYSASALAAAEFPDLDVSFRGAVSIARRLQDPLAELVKIDPKSIGVGQYQHDLNQMKLAAGLDDVLEDCVNAVGADVNTASVPLLKSVAGLSETVARNVVAFRDAHGRFKNRDQIKAVPRMGDKTYEQAVGFLRVVGGDNPLDASAVHPESYPIVDQILKELNLPIQSVMGNDRLLDGVSLDTLTSDTVGLLTVKDILQELKKPGRDPRPEFKAVKFEEGIDEVTDLKVGMKLEGVITNVANFGAFVDVGVHQDGLVHISEVSDQYVSDIHKVVKVGQLVQVTVTGVDLQRKRIGMSMKTEPGKKVKSTEQSSRADNRKTAKPAAQKKEKATGASLLAEQLQRALTK